MNPDFWHERWNADRIGFHQSRVNERLEQFWPDAAVDPGATVFVPLCGKTLDMLWLHERGHPVFGIELSEKAVAAFFAENSLTHAVTRTTLGVEYTGTGCAEGLRLIVGDYFALTAADLSHVGALYDRASLIAMNDVMRSDYTAQLGDIVPAGAGGLLLTIDYDPARMQGPPFPVPDEIVHALLDKSFIIDELECASGEERLGNLKNRGLDTLTERVYRLQRRGG